MSTQQFDVIVVGAGFGGIGAAIQLKKLGYENILIVDREDDLGGTWHVNHYPGLACDIPSATYSYWFEPNPEWSRFYAPGPEIKRYAAQVADKYDVRRHMRFGCVVQGAGWDEDAEHWNVTLDSEETLTTRFLVVATGVLSQPQNPDIPGIQQFAGRIVHTTAWDDEVDLRGQRVGIIGTGATAVQLIPELAKSAAELTVYQRTPIHVVPKLDFAIPGFFRRLFARAPFTQRIQRWITDMIYEASFVSAIVSYDRFWWLNSGAATMSGTLRFASIRDRTLRHELTPQYDMGCKRPTFSNSYYRTLTMPHVRMQAHGIDRIDAEGIVANDGTRTELDTLVLATGFDTWEANFPAIEIIGRGDRNLGKWWRGNGFRNYQGVTVPHFPNLINLASPYAVSLNFFDMMEYQMRHMHRLFTELHRCQATTFEPTEVAAEQFSDRLSKLQADTVFHRGNCAGARSYYFAPDGRTYLRAATTKTTLREQDVFPLSDYVFN